MRKIHIIIFLCLAYVLSAKENANSLAFSGSYMMRAKGTECLLWNPANLYLNDFRLQFELPSVTFSADNNAVSISRYNSINGNYISEKMKNDLYSDINDAFRVNVNSSANIIAVSMGRNALGLRIHSFSRAKASEKYLKLILSGNEENEIYRFDEKNNSAGSVNFAELSFATSRHLLSSYIPWLKKTATPDIRVGLGINFLAGLFYSGTSKYDGIFYTDDTGLNLDHVIEQKNGLGGYGFRGTLSFASDINENFSAGISFNNILGFINWGGTTEKIVSTAHIDSLFAIDTSADLLPDDTRKHTIGNFKTSLPLYLRFGMLYDKDKYSLSLDWEQGTKNSAISSTSPEVAIGGEYMLKPVFPLRMGFLFGNKDHNYKLSYGTGYIGKHFEITGAIQTTHFIFPCNHARGIAFSLMTKLTY